MLAARLIAALDTEEAAQRRNHRVEEGDAGNIDAPTFLMQKGAKLRVDQGEHDDPGLGLDMGQYATELAFRADERPQMLDGIHALELCRRGPRYRNAGLAGGVGDQVQVEAPHGFARVPGHAVLAACAINAQLWKIR